jgi:putative membrane protein
MRLDELRRLTMNKTRKAILIAGGALTGILILVSLIFGWGYSGWGMMGPGMMGGFGGMGLMFLFWIVLFGLIIWAVVAAIRRPVESNGYADSALDILKRRYASGEINKEAYEEKKKDLI